MSSDLLIPQEKYLESGVHIGTRIKTPHMKPYIYKVREDGLYVLDLKKLDAKIKAAGKLIARYDPATILVVASRTFAQQSARVFCDILGCVYNGGRFMPGTFTNPKSQYFKEPKLVFVADPKTERQAVKEAALIGVPVIALCDTDNLATNIDLIVPCNNKGKKSLQLIFYLILSEALRTRGSPVPSFEDFCQKMETSDEDESADENVAVEEKPTSAPPTATSAEATPSPPQSPASSPSPASEETSQQSQN